MALSHHQKIKRRWLLWLVFFGVLAAGAVVFSLVHESGAGIRFSDLWLGNAGERQLAQEIFWGARLPRVLMGAIAGFALAAAGVAFQALLRNPLADPYVLGVTGGASLGGVLGLVFFRPWPEVTTACAFLGALAAMFMMYAVAKKSGGGRLSIYALLLSGVALTSFTTALIMFVNALTDMQQAHEVLQWLTGTLSTASLPTVGLFAVYTVLGWYVIFMQTPAYNALNRGEEAAEHLGVGVEKVKNLTFFAASLLVGAVVARCGMIGFVGLMVPHMARLFVGADHRVLLPAASLLGAAFLVLTDTVARRLLFPTELPVGVITALLGGPFFVFLLLSKRKF